MEAVGSKNTNNNIQPIVDLYKNGLSISEIAEISQKPRSTVSSIIARYRIANGLDRNVYISSRKKKFTDEQIKTILSWVDAKRTTTLRELKEKATMCFNIETSEKTMERYLKEFNYAMLPSNTKCKTNANKKLVWTKIPTTKLDPLSVNNESTISHDSLDNKEEITCNPDLKDDEVELYIDSSRANSSTDNTTNNDDNNKSQDFSKTSNNIDTLQLQREKLQISLLEDKIAHEKELHALRLQNENDLHEIKVKHEIESHRQHLRYAQEMHKAKMLELIKEKIKIDSGPPSF